MEFETRRRSEERAHFLRPLKRMEDIENRFELTEKSGFEGNAKLFSRGREREERRSLFESEICIPIRIPPREFDG